MQEIANIRIDERLIHGQVAISWTHTVGANRIVIVDDEIVKDELQKPLLKMACPAGVKLSILSVPTAINNLVSQKYDNDRIFLVVKRPQVLVSLWEGGFRFNAVNVGNMSGKENAVQIKKAVCVTPEDIAAFRTLHANGVRLTAQMVPNDEELKLMELIKG
ncbi:MAG: PTS sugar transporter subunit IIB [Synergistaceae bacterium]|jgi:PTS system mannose-specific IIB component|nr:PTS sugar transporter subunit IIB [Synergistaceae bacterium]